MLRSSRLFTISLCLSVCLGLLFVDSRAGGQELSDVRVSRLVTTPVDDSSRIVIVHSTHPQAQARFDAGIVDPSLPMERMILVMGASADQERQARTFLDSQQTKGSPDYHHWLTPEQFGQKFGPAPEDIQQVTSWLRRQGFHINAVAKSGRWIEFSGNAAQVATAFQTEMHHYL